MANWSKIPNKLLRKIATEHVESLEDFETLAGVCCDWRDAMKVVNFWPSKNTQHPWLMLVDPPDSTYSRFYSLSKRMFRKFHLPQLRVEDDDHLRYFSSKGWLISVSRRNRNITLFDPVSVSVKVIKPPSLPLNLLLWDEPWDDDSYTYHFYKFILSRWPSPSCGDDDDIAAVMIFDAVQRLAIWTPGENNWTVIPTKNNWVYDVCFFKGEFYAIDHLGLVIAFGVEVAKREPRNVVDLIEQGVLSGQTYGTLYLVEVEGTLFVIHRYVCSLGDEDFHGVERPRTNEKYWTCRFEVYELDVDYGKAKQVKGVGNRAIFVGFSSSTFSVDASSNQYGCKANCIYFTDDNLDDSYSSELGGGSDIGIYSLAEGKIIERFYQGPSQFCFVNPPIWVERPHH